MNVLLNRNTILVFVVLASIAPSARAQIVVIDDVILLTSKQKAQQGARSHQHLDPPGGTNLLPPSPGADEPRLGEERDAALLFPSPLSRRFKRRGSRGRILRLRTDGSANPLRDVSTLSGPLELPLEEEGPSEGLALDAAIDRLLEANANLAAKHRDIPKARADILTAGLRSNPFLFVSVSSIPYGQYSVQRPGATLYDLTVIQPLDVNGKRQWRIRAAQEAKLVVEAQYQDAVRLEMDRMQSAFVDVLEARQSVQALRAGLARWTTVSETIHSQVDRGLRSASDAAAAAFERTNAELALQSAETKLLQTRRDLALLLGFDAEQADGLRIVGSLRDRAPPPPEADELVHLALQTRPDLAAYRLGIHRALADVRRERAEALDNVFLFYTPYTSTDYSPLGKRSANGWGLGFLFPLPLFDRNQGDIARARVNVAQTGIESEALERHVVHEVLSGATEFAVSRDVVQEYEKEILTDARILRDEQYRLLTEGRVSLDSYLQAQKEFDDVIRDYLEALVYHRRCMLRLNVVMGQRILP